MVIYSWYKNLFFMRKNFYFLCDNFLLFCQYQISMVCHFLYLCYTCHCVWLRCVILPLYDGYWHTYDSGLYYVNRTNVLSLNRDFVYCFLCVFDVVFSCKCSCFVDSIIWNKRVPKNDNKENSKLLLIICILLSFIYVNIL